MQTLFRKRISFRKQDICKQRHEAKKIIKETNILIGELTRSKNNIYTDDKNVQSCSSTSDDDDDDELNDLVMSEATNSSIVGQFVGCVLVQCNFLAFLLFVNRTY